MNVYIDIYIHMHARMYSCTYVYIHVRMHVFTHVSLTQVVSSRYSQLLKRLQAAKHTLRQRGEAVAVDIPAQILRYRQFTDAHR